MTYSKYRTELEILRSQGVIINNPHDVVDLFEKKIAHFAGSDLAVVTDSATHALELSLRYLIEKNEIHLNDVISIPKHTYISVPQMLRKLGFLVEWNDDEWQGYYQLKPLRIYDASLLFSEKMHIPNSFFCLSFQYRKHLPIGRGGAILTNDPVAYHWLKRACYDGRNPGIEWKKDSIQQMGFHYYMPPEDAARGILLMKDYLRNTTLFSALGGWADYPDLTESSFFKEINTWA